MSQRTVNDNVDLSDNISSIAADAGSLWSDQRPGRLLSIRPADIYQQLQEQNDMANVPGVAQTSTTEAQRTKLNVIDVHEGLRCHTFFGH